MTTILCDFCGNRFSEDDDHEELSAGEIVCETCLYDAMAHHGQHLNNVRHLKRQVEALIIAWSED